MFVSNKVKSNVLFFKKNKFLTKNKKRKLSCTLVLDHLVDVLLHMSNVCYFEDTWLFTLVVDDWRSFTKFQRIMRSFKLTPFINLFQRLSANLRWTTAINIITTWRLKKIGFLMRKLVIWKQKREKRREMNMSRNTSTLVQTKEGVSEICWMNNWRVVLRSLMKGEKLPDDIINGVLVKIWLQHFPICPMMIHSFLHLFHIILLPSFQSLPYPPGSFHCFLCSSIWSISLWVIISPCGFTISSLALFADVLVTLMMCTWAMCTTLKTLGSLLYLFDLTLDLLQVNSQSPSSWPLVSFKSTFCESK